MRSILVSIFRLGLLRLSAGTYEAISSTAANLVSHWERFWCTSVQFGNVQKAFLITLREKTIANILRFLGQRESKLVRKNPEKLPKLFHHGFMVKIFKQKPPECPLKTKFLCYPTPYSHFVKKFSDFICFDLSYFINFYPYFNSYISFRQEYFSFRPYFCLIADIQGIIYFTITFPPLIFSQNKIYYKTINYVISVIPNMICSAVSVHSSES